MQAIWFKGLSPEEKKKRKAFLLANQEVFDLLYEVLEKEFEDSVPDYNSSSWAYEQADVNGANRKLRSILKLIKLTKD